MSHALVDQLKAQGMCQRGIRVNCSDDGDVVVACAIGLDIGRSILWKNEMGPNLGSESTGEECWR